MLPMKNLSFPGQTKLFDFRYISIILFFLLFIYGCGSVISSSTVNLSADVGSRISEMEKLHQLAVQRYFDLEQQKIEDFLTKTWEPLFLKNFLGTSQVLEQLKNVSSFTAADRSQIEEVVSLYLIDSTEAPKMTDSLMVKLDASRKNEGDEIRAVVSEFIDDDKVDEAVIHITSLLNTDEPAQIMLDFAEDAHNEMNAQREKLLAPLTQLRQETAAELSAAYAELIRGQSTITGRLEAAAKVGQQQEQLRSALGINTTTKNIESKLSNITSKVDSALNKVSGLTAGDGEAGVSLPETILKTLKTELEKKLN
jgi:hypothetical protein